MSISCSLAISWSRSPNAPLSTTRILPSRGTHDEIAHSIAAVPLPVTRQTVCSGVPRKMRRSFPVSDTISSEKLESRWQTSWWTSALFTVAVVLTGPGLRSV